MTKSEFYNKLYSLPIISFGASGWCEVDVVLKINEQNYTVHRYSDDIMFTPVYVFDANDRFEFIPKKSALTQMDSLLKETDIESAHSQADAILCDVLESLGQTELVNKFKQLTKRYA